MHLAIVPRQFAGYGEKMPARRGDEDVDGTEEAGRARARQGARAALALAIVFGSLPLASELFLGNWGFDSAPAIACVCLVGAAYLHFRGRRSRPPIPDSAAILGEAIRLASAGQTELGIALLDEAFRLDSHLWQARQYRGELRLGESEAVESALQDFTDAIGLAPDEPHLYLLRSHVYGLLGREAAARADLEAAARLNKDAGRGSERA